MFLSFIEHHLFYWKSFLVLGILSSLSCLLYHSLSVNRGNNDILTENVLKIHNLWVKKILSVLPSFMSASSYGRCSVAIVCLSISPSLIYLWFCFTKLLNFFEKFIKRNYLSLSPSQQLIWIGKSRSPRHYHRIIY